MPKSLRVKLGGLRYKGILADKDYKRLCKALDNEDILEKVSVAILDEAEYAYTDFDRYKEDILHAEPDELPDDDFRYGMERAVEIINKYRKGGAEMSGGVEYEETNN